MRTRSQQEGKTPAQLDLFGEPVDPRRGEAPDTPEEDVIVRAALEHLNTVTDRTGAARFTSAKSIKARIEDGAVLEDLLLVIDFCYAMWWGDPKMETFVRPKTLFGKENFPEYLVRARKWSVDGRPSLLGGAARQGAGDRRIDTYSAHVKGGRA